jgi:hypothetical protein
MDSPLFGNRPFDPMRFLDTTTLPGLEFHGLTGQFYSSYQHGRHQERTEATP